MSQDFTRDLSDALLIKLSIEPTGLTQDSIAGLSRKAEEVTESVVRAQQAYSSLSEQALITDQIAGKLDYESYNIDNRAQYERATQSQVLDYKSTQSMEPKRSLALNKAEDDMSMSTRGLATDDDTISRVSRSGGFRTHFKASTDKEDGNAIDQASVVGSRVFGNMSDAIKEIKSPSSDAPKVLASLDKIAKEGNISVDLSNAPMSILEKIEKNTAGIGRSIHAQDKEDTSDFISEFIQRLNDDRADREFATKAHKDQTTSADRAARSSEQERTTTSKILSASMQRGQSTGGQQDVNSAIKAINMLDKFAGNRTSSYKRANDFGEKLLRTGSAISSLAGPDASLEEDGGINVLEAGGLIRAGGKLAGMAGMGKIGSGLSRAGAAVGGAASGVGLALAAGSAIYAGADKISDFVNDTSMYGHAQGDQGLDAMTAGLGQRFTSFRKGFNPFDQYGSKDFDRWREMALESGYNFELGSSEFSALEDSFKSARDMGLSESFAQAMFAQAIHDNPDFDYNEAISEMAEATKEANMSLKDFSSTMTDVYTTLSSQFGGGEDMIEVSEDIATMIQEGEFDTGSGILKGMSDAEATRFVSKVFDPFSEQGARAMTILSENKGFMEKASEEGIGLDDPVALAEFALKNMSPEEIEGLVNDVAFYGIEWAGDNKTLGGQIVYQNTGYRPSADVLGEYATDRMQDRPSIRTGHGVYSGSVQFGENKTKVEVTVKADSGFSTQVRTSTEYEDSLTGNSPYESITQTGIGQSGVPAYGSGQ